jgi:hypothetical protein
MELNVDELIEKIYDYYPKHISPFSVEFDESTGNQMESCFY